MPHLIRNAAAWAAHHALTSITAAVLAVGVAGGGITYAVAAHAAAAPSTPSAATASPAAGARHHAAGRPGAALAAVNRVLGLLATDSGQSIDAIRTQLQTGTSLGQVVGASAATRFETDVLAQLRARADRAVAAGRITATQETARLAKAKALLDKLMAEPGTTLLQQLHRLQRFGRPPVAASPAPST